MPEDPIHQPHDKLFKASFSDPANAAAFLRWEVPPALSGKIAWDQLRVEPGSFVDSHYRHTESDLLFSAKVAGTDALLYLLFEHQTSPDPVLALRLLRYMVRIWEDYLKQHPGSPRLPVILPIVLAQSAEVWELSPRFASLLDLPPGCEDALRYFIPDFTFQLIQLAALPFDAIRGTPAGIMTLRIMKAERVAQLLADPVWDEALLLQVPRTTLELLLRYLLHEAVDKAAFARKVQSITQPELQNTAMSIAEQLRQEGLQKGLQKGRQEGIQEGRQEGIQEDILEALTIRFEQVPDGLREAITAIHESAHLRRLHRAAIQSATLEDFARSL
jgi:predicted transposase/invertase (TIGR01784 family)